jgi:hypothetical protein
VRFLLRCPPHSYLGYFQRVAEFCGLTLEQEADGTAVAKAHPAEMMRALICHCPYTLAALEFEVLDEHPETLEDERDFLDLQCDQLDRKADQLERGNRQKELRIAELEAEIDKLEAEIDKLKAIVGPMATPARPRRR